MRKLLCLVMLASVLLCGIASAENITASRSLMGKGPTGLLVPLGIENSMSLQDAYIYYNWICIIMLFSVGAISTRVNSRFVMIILPLLAAMLVFFGWLNSTDDGKTWGLIVVCGIMGGALYMKGSLKENFGVGGPGNTIMLIVTYLIILQAVVGFVNTNAIWDTNISPDTSQYLNVNLEDQVVEVNNMGGFFNTIQDIGSILLSAAINILRFILTMVASVTVFALVLAQIFPWIGDSTMGLAFLAVIQVAIWISYILLVFQWFFKPSLDSGLL